MVQGQDVRLLDGLQGNARLDVRDIRQVQDTIHHQVGKGIEIRRDNAQDVVGIARYRMAFRISGIAMMALANASGPARLWLSRSTCAKAVTPSPTVF